MAKLHTPSETESKAPRWRRIIDLPGDTLLKDLATGWVFWRRNLTPLYSDAAQSRVETFRLDGTQPEYVGRLVDARLIRRESDGPRCTL